MKKWYIELLISISIVCGILGLVFLAIGCNRVPREFHDNPIEESVEAYLEEKSGVKIDFTGASPENDVKVSD